MVLIDGVRSTAAALSRLAPASIASIEVVKGSAAVALYREPEAANGVIHVRLKPVSGAP
jgi:outer membrane cobalamin receptor